MALAIDGFSATQSTCDRRVSSLCSGSGSAWARLHLAAELAGLVELVSVPELAQR